IEQFSRDPDYRSRFTREAHAAAQLQEPHVIPIHDWGEIDGSLYIDMRMVRGTDLRKVLRSGPMPPDRVVHIVSQIASALDAAHADGLIHRDVKPENIIVTSDDFAYLLDFGIAEKTGDVRLTQAGMTVGSLAYMAPERLN
ncbi:serine/threonine-protein kinase, partial [Mycolicibacter algericus]